MQNTNLLPYNGRVNYYENVIMPDMVKNYMDILLKTINWKHDEVTLFGKNIITKRKTAWYGEPGLTYTYSGNTKTALAFTSELIQLKSIAEAYSDTIFNSCLLNLYHDGTEGMGWHSDNEKEMGSTIASLSLGAERKFVFKHRHTKHREEIYLNPGSLLVMMDETQQYWLHSLPVSKRVESIRINLTFRNVI